MADIQYPLKKVLSGYNNYPSYVYACNGCGKECGGYVKSQVRGHVYCYKCKVENEKSKSERKQTAQTLQIKKAVINDIVAEIRREFPECNYVADWVETVMCSLPIKEQNNE